MTDGPGTHETGGPAGQGGQPPGPGARSPAEPGEILTDLARLRRRTRRARHAYWFPLLLFGLLTLASVPLYMWASQPLIHGYAPLTRVTTPSGTVPSGTVSAREVPAPWSGPFVLGGRPAGMASVYLEWYWAFALIGGFLLTWLWYSHHTRKTGVQTPSRGAVATGVALSVLVLAVPPLTTRVLPWGAFGDLWMRGTIAFVVVAAGLWALAWAERSRALAAIALVYTAAALLSALYHLQNVVFRLGWNPGPGPFRAQMTVLPNVLLPAAILLAGGLGALLAQRLRRPA